VLTVLFSTYNGAATLPRTLAAFEALQAPPDGWRLVAVDNGSADDSGAILARHADRLPMTLLVEPRRGKNAALNSALDRLEGDLAVLTDDDVVPAPDWLVAWRTVADECPGYDIFGGAIEPVWPAPPPDWIFGAVPKGFFAWTDFEEGPAPPERIWGPNMAVRRAVFETLRFSEGIGPDQTSGYATGSETEFVMRAARAGRRCWHSHAPRVGHIVEPRQLTAVWVLQRAFNQARSARRLAALRDDVRASLQRPRHRVTRLARAMAGAALARLFGDHEAQLRAGLLLRQLQGDAAEWRFQRRRARASG
jgi:hypothetical protein